MATEGNCNRIFVSAGERRAAYPLKSGAYKLREALVTLQQQLETVKAIELIVMTKSRPHPDEILGCCVAGERANWLKSVPKSIAEILGFSVIPAVRALKGDGVPFEAVDRLLDVAIAQSARIVPACDQAGAILSRSVESEYLAMRSGRSAMAQLLLNAIALIRDALEQAEPYRLRGLWT